VTSDVEFILTNTDRLITVTIRCVISFGAADGLNAPRGGCGRHCLGSLRVRQLSDR
jgi:hypothetical protein